MTYARYKFQKAISELSRDGTLRERLINAFLVNLIHIDQADLPETVRNDFLNFKYRIIQNHPETAYQTVESMVIKMDDPEVQKLIDTLFSMYEVISKQEYLDQVA